MTAYTKYSPAPTEDATEKPNTAFDYSSVFSYGSAFTYDSNNSGHFKSAFDYGYSSSKYKSSTYSPGKKRNHGFRVLDCISLLLTWISYFFIGVSFPITLWFCIKKLDQWERIIVFRIGKLKGVLGPGTVFIIPWIDKYTRVDMRTKAFSVPPQQLITVDNGIIEMGCEVKYRVSDVKMLTTSVTTPKHGLRSFGKTVMINVLTKHTVREMERDRLLIASEMLKELNDRVMGWGMEIGGVELSTVNVLKEPEEPNAMKPVLNALGCGGSGGMSSALEKILSMATGAPQASSLLIDKDESRIGNEKSKLFAQLQNLVEGPSGSELSHGQYRFEVEGNQGGVFHLNISNGFRKVSEGEDPLQTPDVSVTLSHDDLLSILEGSIAPLHAYLSGRLTVTGNVQLLMSFETLRQSGSNGAESDGIFVA